MAGAAARFRSSPASALHLRIYPAPANLAESKAILQELRRHGEITTYKNLKYDRVGNKPAPNSALAICRTVDGASKLLSRSPLQLRIDPGPSPIVTPARPGKQWRDLFEKMEAEDPDVKAKRNSQRTPSGTQPAGLESRSTQSGSQVHVDDHSSGPNTPFNHHRKQFLIHASPWRGDIALHLERSPFTGPFSIDTDAPAQQELAQVVPQLGLSMISRRQEPVPQTVINARREAAGRRLPLRAAMPSPGEVPDHKNLMRDLRPFLTPVVARKVIKHGSWQDLTTPDTSPAQIESSVASTSATR